MVCKLCRYHRHFLKWYLPRKGCWAGHGQVSPTPLMARESMRQHQLNRERWCRRAIKLLRRLFALGLSRYEPDPVAAIERAERAEESSPGAVVAVE